ncbi:hypothetical protein BC835DRAFT_1395213 [Cytidiella melzeri]|nr:hypothetical protein BC835DRAFT_1395213 [Cytidiella melzeri]
MIGRITVPPLLVARSICGLPRILLVSDLHDRASPWLLYRLLGSGWGNYMQDMLLNAALTYHTGRSYVFDNYTWQLDGPEVAEWNGNKIPARIPLSAFISGPIVGGKFEDGDQTPLAVAKPYFEAICPNPTKIRVVDIVNIHGDNAPAMTIVKTWIDHINKIDDPCIHVVYEFGQIFNINMHGDRDKLLPAYPWLSKTPSIYLFGWGALIYQSFENNRHLFAPKPMFEPYSTAPGCPHCLDPVAPLDGLLALHLRRGDFLEHCVNLAHWGAAFQAFATFPEFPDPWVWPQGDDDAKMAVYMRRCLPTNDQIVEKIRAVRNSPGGQGLKNIYVMTNGDRQWVAELKSRLYSMGGWDKIATSRDLVMTLAEKQVSQAMDMMIGQRAQVIIGNGFSSMTSNIALLRQVHKMPADTMHLW